jgi:hypothetical protein
MIEQSNVLTTCQFDSRVSGSADVAVLLTPLDLDAIVKIDILRQDPTHGRITGGIVSDAKFPLWIRLAQHAIYTFPKIFGWGVIRGQYHTNKWLAGKLLVTKLLSTIFGDTRVVAV